VDAETFAPGTGKQHVAITALRLAQPGLQHGKSRSGDGRATLLTFMQIFA
jgi:hypothetical protein